jgi:PAS domain S-box-containing protein
MTQFSPRILLHYLVAFVSVALATGFRLLLDPLLGNAFPFATLFLAVLFVAWYAGFGPALAATLMGALFAVFLLFRDEPLPTPHGFEQHAGLVLYLVVGLGIAILGGTMHAARHRAEIDAAATSRQHAELQITLQSIGDAVIVTNEAGNVLSLNPIAESLTGWTAAEATGKSLDEVFVIQNEQTRQMVESPVARVLKSGMVVGLANHTVLISKDGIVRPIDDSAAPIRDMAGRLTGVVLVFRDVSDRRRAEDVNRRLAAIVESSDDAILGKDMQGLITTWNAGAERIYGYRAEEIVGKLFSILVPPDRTHEVQEVGRRLQRGERLDHFETVRRRKDGSHIDVSISYSPIRNDQGELIGTAVITRDITKQKQAEKELLQREQDLADFFESATIGLHWVGPDGVILRANRAVLEMLGYAEHEYVGRNIAEFHVDGIVIDQILRCLGQGERLHNYPAQMRCKDGSIRDVVIDSSVRWDGDRFVHTRCFTRDVTDQKRAEEAARSWQRQLQFVTDNAPVYLAHLNSEQRFLFVNQPYAARFGLHPRDIIGKTIPEVLGDDVSARIAPYVNQVLQGRRVQFEMRVPYRELGEKVVSCVYEPEFDDNRRVVGYVGAILDVTENKRMERALREVESQFAAVVDYAPACIFAKDRQGRYLFANRALAELVGRQPEEFPGRTDYDFFPSAVADEFRRDDAAIMASAQSRTYEESFHHNGVTRTYLTVKFPLRNEHAEIYATCAVATDVTDLKRVQEELQSTAERLNLALAAANLGDWSWNASTDMVTFSQRAADIFGITAGSNLTWTVMQGLLHEEDRERARLAVERSVEERSPYDIEYRLKRADGTPGWVSVIGRAHYAANGQPLGMFGLIQDITERKQAEEALRQSEARSRNILESITDAFYAIDRDWRFTYVNHQAEVLLGHRREDLIGKNFWEEFPEAVGSAFDEAYHRCMNDDVTVSFEVYYPPHERWYEVHTYPSPNGLAVYFRDISEQKQLTERLESERKRLVESEGNLRLREEQLSLLTNALPVLISFVDSEQRYQIVNRAYEVWFGHTRQEIQNKTMREVLGDSAYEALRKEIDEALSGREVTFERLVPYREGGTRYIHATYIPYRENDTVKGFYVLVSDITQSKRAEQDARFLADASASLAGLVDFESTLQTVARLAVPHFADWASVDMLEENGTLRRVAVAHVDSTKVELAHELHRRYPPDPASPQGVWNILRTGQSELISDVSDALLTSTIKDPELLSIVRALGLRSYMGVPLSVRGKVLGVITFIAAESGRKYQTRDLAVAEDLAHRAAVAIENGRLYQELRIADRKKDEFLSLLAHELRNPLAPISNALQILKVAHTNGELAGHARDMAERQVHALTRMVDDLLDVSRIMRGKVELRRERVQLASVISAAIETARPAIDAGQHQLDVTLPQTPIWIDVDPVRIAQVVSNLLTNAAKYTTNGGQIWLSVVRNNEVATIQVRDTGIGIAPDKLRSVFEMFMQVDATGSRAQGGLGIGLTVVRSLVELHGGSVEATSAGLGLGSEFTVHLPLPAEVISGNNESPAKGHVNKQTPRRILVVDDNVDAAESLAMLLRLQGHHVSVAHDAISGLHQAEVEQPEIAFLDIGMPVMNGHELAKRFRGHPTLNGTMLIAMTGWGQESDRRRTKETGFDHHLVKPVEVDALFRLISPHTMTPLRVDDNA